jgi:hypothetical protein
MFQLTDLPAETLTKIMQECPDVKSVLRLASTNRLMQQIWQLNTVSITCAVFGFTQRELLATLELSKIEAPTPEQDLWPAAQAIDLNSAIRHHLFWVARLAFAVQAVYQYYLADQLQDNPRMVVVTEDEQGVQAEFFKAQEPSWRLPHIMEALFTLRRFAVGVSHPPSLRAAYVDLHGLSRDDICKIVEITSVFQRVCMIDRDHIVIGTRKKWHEQRQEEIEYQSDPSKPLRPTMTSSWGCADNMIRGELWWRPAPPGSDLTSSPEEKEETVRLHCEDMCRTCGEVFVKAAYGGDEIPWTAERLASYEMS